MTEQAKVPAIRFAGFTDPWEQRKLGEIVSIGAGAPPSAFSAGNFLYVKVLPQPARFARIHRSR